MRTAVWGVAGFAALMMIQTSAPAAEMGKGGPDVCRQPGGARPIWKEGVAGPG